MTQVQPQTQFRIRIPGSIRILKTQQVQKSVSAVVLADVPIDVLAVGELAPGKVAKLGLAAEAEATHFLFVGASLLFFLLITTEEELCCVVLQ